MKKLIYLLFLCCLGLNAQQLAFPTAKGAGAYVSGGRGGQIIHVNTLLWDAPLVNVGGVLYGGLKEAIQTPGARIVVFDVSGTFDATGEGGFSDIINGSTYDNLTIAGQTAPLGGVTILTSEFRFRDVDNIIIRYVRFRRTNSGLTGSYSKDTLWFINNDGLIFDHCVFSHGNDESASFAFSSGSMDNVTIQRCFFQDSKTGSIIGVNGFQGNISVLNNVFSNISHRFPNHKGAGRADIIGNIVYNWKERLVRLGDVGTYNGQANVFNNYYKGAANGLHQPSWFPGYNLPITRLHRLQVNNSSTGLIYTAGNFIFGQRETPQTDDSDMWSVFNGSSISDANVGDPVPSRYFTSTMFPLLGPSFTIQTAEQYYLDVLQDVGANKTLNADGSISIYQDSKDSADILMIQNDTYDGSDWNPWLTNQRPYPVIPENTRPSDYDTDGDGMPDVWETATFGDLSQNSSGDFDSDSITNIEEFLNLIDGTPQNIPVIGVDGLPDNEVTLNVGATLDLNEIISPSNATDKSVVWSRSNTKVVTVDQNGLVTAIAEGTVSVTVTTNDGGFTDTAIVNVVQAETSTLNKKLKIILLSNN